MTYQCQKCGRAWDDRLAAENEWLCSRQCGGTLQPVAATMPAQVVPFVCDTSRLPYPVAITAQRLIESMESSSDVVRRLTYLKECFEATIKFLGGVLLADYFRSPAANSQRNTLLLEKLGRPSLGAWRAVVDDVSRWLVEANIAGTVGRAVATIFVQPPAKMGGKPKLAQLMKDCEEFVTYRNESSFGHGALRSDAACEQDLQDWLPMLRELLNGVERLADRRLCLVTSSDCCSVWMGTERGAVTEADAFAEDLCGHFVLCRSAEVAATCTRQEVIDRIPDSLDS